MTRPQPTGESPTAMQRSPTLELAQRIESLKRQGVQAHSLSTPTFPDRGSMIEMLFNHGAPSTLLAPPEGMGALREAVPGVLFTRWNLPNHSALITSGAKAGLFAILRAIGEPGHQCAIVSPHWPSYDSLCRLAELEPVHFCTDIASGFALEPLAFKELIAAHPRIRILMLSNPNNPTGRIYRAGELNRILEICQEAHIKVVLDESFSETAADTTFWEKQVPDLIGDIFILNSFSKNFHIQGLRLGAAMIPKTFFESCLMVHQAIQSSASTLSQQCALQIISNPRELESNRRVLNTNRKKMAEAMHQLGWRFTQSEGSFYFFPEVPELDVVLALLEKKGVFSLGGDLFGTDYSRFIRVCFARSEAEMDHLSGLLLSLHQH
jgi:aspartate/methionine/tyrosine aminotransferase